MPFQPPTHRAPRIEARKHTAPAPPRLSASQRGYGRAWQRLRRWFLRRNPLCSVCGRLAECVDHVLPLEDGGTNDAENLQPLCNRCHSAKTCRDMARRRRTAREDARTSVTRGKAGSSPGMSCRAETAAGNITRKITGFGGWGVALTASEPEGQEWADADLRPRPPAY